jgi:DNA-binding transcriptional MerR regulator
MYRKKDVELILKIKHLLYSKKFTIAGAKLYLKNMIHGKKITHKTITRRELYEELKEIRKMLD